MSIETAQELPGGDSLQLPAWAHSAGILSLRDSLAPADACAVADRQLFTERIARYCWAYDERRLKALADCFTEDGVWEGNVLGRIQVGPFNGRQRIVQWLSGFWPHQHDQRRHMILNTIVEEQSADTAVTLSYLLLMSSDARSVKLETSGFYRVAYRRVDATWLIERLTGGFDAPFWPGDISKLSPAGRARHGVAPESAL